MTEQQQITTIRIVALAVVGTATYFAWKAIKRKQLLKWYALKKPTIKQSALDNKTSWPNNRLEARKKAYLAMEKIYYWKGLKGGVRAGWYNTRNNKAVKYDNMEQAKSLGLGTYDMETKEMKPIT